MTKSVSLTLIKEQPAAKKPTLSIDVQLNLPDLAFFHWCEQKYKVNRGVYNTIDAWFYEHGIVSIISRRKNILAFLDFVIDSSSAGSHHKFIRFGDGGLTRKLEQFSQADALRGIG
jgi:riboflavin kinase